MPKKHLNRPRLGAGLAQTMTVYSLSILFSGSTDTQTVAGYCIENTTTLNHARLGSSDTNHGS